MYWERTKRKTADRKIRASPFFTAMNTAVRKHTHTHTHTVKRLQNTRSRDVTVSSARVRAQTHRREKKKEEEMYRTNCAQIKNGNTNLHVRARRSTYTLILAGRARFGLAALAQQRDSRVTGHAGVKTAVSISSRFQSAMELTHTPAACYRLSNFARFWMTSHRVTSSHRKTRAVSRNDDSHNQTSQTNLFVVFFSFLFSKHCRV